MLNKIIIVCFLYFIPFYSFSLEVKIHHSEAVSYWHFLNSGFGEPFSSGALKEVIERSHLRVFSESELKKEFYFLKSFLQNGFNYPDESPNRPEGFWGEDAFASLAAQSTSLEDFEKQLSVLIPYRAILAYQNVKNKTYSIFQNLLWKPSLPLQEEQIRKTQDLIDKSKFTYWLEKAKIFYDSEYPDQLPLQVGLIPLPDNKNIKNKHTSATSLRNIQIVPYFINKGVGQQLDVLFHEFCHALYDGQPTKTKNFINDYFMKSSDPHSLFVYRYLNEVLATAWGNGYYYEILNGKPSDESWYNVKYIDELAKGVLPLMKNYVQANKSLDQNFLESTIKRAQEKFPMAPREIDVNLISVSLFIDQDSESFKNIKRELKKNFRIQSIYSSSPIKDEELKDLTETNLKTPIIISSNASSMHEKLQKYIDLRSLKAELKKHEDFWVILPKKNGYIFWINIKNEASFIKLIEKFKELKELPLQATVITISG